MSLEQWLAFALASAVILAIPGPTVLLVVSYAISQGRRAARASVAGVALGDFTAMTASLIGLGAVLAASATLFTALKWIGAAYLVWLGIRMWRSPVSADAPGALVEAETIGEGLILLHTLAVTALNPKSILFFVAFLPQFIDAGAPLLPQLVVAELTFLALASLNAALYGLLASKARTVVTKPSIHRAVNRAGGSLLIAAGLAAAFSRRAPAG